MRTLDRYLLKAAAVRFLQLLVVFLGVVVGGQLGSFLSRGAPPEALIPAILPAMFLALPIALPLAASAALLVVVGSMVRSGEFQALSAAGVDPVRVILRLWPFIAGLAVVVAILAHGLMPYGIREMRGLKGRILQATIATKVANLEPIWDRDGVSAWANHVDGRDLRDVYLRRLADGNDFAAFAPRATWGFTADGIEFRLEDLRIIETRANGDLLAGEFAHYVIHPRIDDSVLQTEPDAMGTPAVLAELRNSPSTGPDCSRFNNARLTLHLRLFMPVALFAFALFAVGLGMVFALGETLAAIAVNVVVVALATYPAIGYVKSEPKAEQFDPGLLLWSPTLVLAGLGWWMLAHPRRAAELLGRPLALGRHGLRAGLAIVLHLVRRIRRAGSRP